LAACGDKRQVALIKRVLSILIDKNGQAISAGSRGKQTLGSYYGNCLKKRLVLLTTLVTGLFGWCGWLGDCLI